jgi:hypothetical protein
MPSGDAEPATPPPSRGRGPRHFAAGSKASGRTGEPRERREFPIRVADDTTTIQRIRSGVVLGLLIAIIGAIAAIAIGVTAVVVVTALKQAVG